MIVATRLLFLTRLCFKTRVSREPGVTIASKHVIAWFGIGSACVTHIRIQVLRQSLVLPREVQILVFSAEKTPENRISRSISQTP